MSLRWIPTFSRGFSAGLFKQRESLFAPRAFPQCDPKYFGSDYKELPVIERDYELNAVAKRVGIPRISHHDGIAAGVFFGSFAIPIVVSDMRYSLNQKFICHFLHRRNQ